MKPALQLAGVIFLAVAIACMIVGARDLHTSMLALQVTLRDVDGAVTDLRATTKRVDATLDNVTAATAQLELAAGQERAYWNKTSEESAKAMRDLRQITARLDRSVNDKLIPDIDAAMLQTSTAAQSSLGALQQSASALTARLNDPKITDLTAHLDMAALNFDVASARVADGVDHLDKATADIETEIHRVTRPPSMLKQIGMGILDVGAKLGSIFAGFVR